MSSFSARRVLPPDWALRILSRLRGIFLKAAELLTPPDLRIFERSTGVIWTHALGAAARLRIADRLQAGPKDVAALANETGVDANSLIRLLRMLAHGGIFSMDSQGRFLNNQTSKTLIDRPGASRYSALYWSLPSTVQPWADVDETIRTGQGAARRILGKSIWDWYAENQDEKEVFSQFMITKTRMEAPMVAEWPEFARARVVCDVGGGAGTLLTEILIHCPHLKGIWTDSPDNAASAAKMFIEHGIEDRTTMVPGNFFESVPAGADVYVLKNILHDWNDETSLKILSNVRQAMTKNSQLLVVEQILDPANVRHFTVVADAHMMIACDQGKERSEDELRKLLSSSGFRPGKLSISALGLGLLAADFQG